jgi:hypothetical protein
MVSFVNGCICSGCRNCNQMTNHIATYLLSAWLTT